MFLSSPLGTLTEPLSGKRWDPATIRVEIDRRVARYAQLGLRRGDAVFLHCANCLELFAELSAVWLLGGCVVPVDARLTPFEVEALARAAEPRFAVFGDAPDQAIVARLTSLGVELVGPGELSRADRGGGGPSGAERALSLDDPALILFTSGTTGNPKGVVHTHRSLRARWMALRQSLGVHRYRRTLCVLPTHFGHGLICNCLFPWLSGADLFILPPFRPDIVMDLGRIIDEHEITFMSSVPSLWRLALRTARPPARATLERVFCGSAPLSASLWTSIQQWTGIDEVWNAYGITETGSWVAGTSSGAGFVPQDGLVGEPWGAVVKVLRSSATDAGPPLEDECAAGEQGFVWLNTPAIMQGYLRRDDLTRAVMTQGWFMTGDIGFIDEGGRLFLRGRIRDEINKGGMKVFPADVDAVLEAADGVTDVCTFGYEGDPLYGENIGVAVVIADTSDEQLGRIYRHVTERLASHQLPARWYLMSEIPRTSRGKVNRSQVAEACAKMTPFDWRRVLRGTT